MSDEQRTVKAAKFKQWYEKIAEIFKDDPKKRATGNKLTAIHLLSRLERIGLETGAVESGDFPTSIAGQLERRYRQKQDFDWVNGVIVIGPASWAGFTGAEGLIEEIVRATGIPEHD